MKKVLFIDCDTLVMQDLTPLWEMDMGDKWLYGVDDCRGAAYRTNLGLQPTDNYINNGVLLVDLDAWRKNNVEDMFLRYIRENQGDITFVDQGVQNGVLSKLGRSGILPPKYNCMTVFFAFDYKNLIKLRKPPVPGDPAQACASSARIFLPTPHHSPGSRPTACAFPISWPGCWPCSPWACSCTSIAFMRSAWMSWAGA